MSKSKFYAELIEGLQGVFAEYSIDKVAEEAVLEVVNNVLKPKTSRGSVETTLKDDAGNVIAILDIHSKLYLPATNEFFYEDKAGKGINGLKRISKLGEGISKKFNAAKQKEIAAIKDSIIAGEIDNTKGLEKIEAIKATKPDFSSMNQYAVNA